MAVTSALLEAAYTNVSLLADTAWAPCSIGPMGLPLTGSTVDASASATAVGSRTGVAFRRANQDLWLRCVNLDRYICKNHSVSTNDRNGNSYHSSTSSNSTNNERINERYRCRTVGKEDESGEKRPRTVRDTIPFSRLASYGGQVAYNEERERLYTADDGIYTTTPITQQDSKLAGEPWLMTAVEEIFKQLTALPERLPKQNKKCHEYPDENFSGTTRLSSVEPDLPQQLKFWGKAANRDESQSSSLQLKHSKSEPQLSTVQRYTLTNHDEIRLQMKIRAQAVQDLWTKINNQVRLGQSSSQLQIQKARQINYYHHHHGHQQMHSSGRLTRHRSLSRFPVLQMHNSVVPQLNVDVPEFYPKTNGPPLGLLMGTGSSCPAGIGDCGGANAFRHSDVANAVTIFLSPANELTYQEELFPYRNQHDTAHQHKLQSLDQVAGIFVRPPGSGTVPLEPLTRPNNSWFLSNTANSNGKSTPPAKLPTPPLPASQPPLPPLPPYKSLKVTRHSARNGKMQSIPIPVYQRPPEFYTQQNEAATSGNGTGGTIGTRRRTGGNGVDFSNLILLTRGGKGHNRPCASFSPSTPSVSSRTESFASDTKAEASSPLASADTSTEPSKPPSNPQIPTSQSNQSSDDVFQWLHAAFSATKTKNHQQSVVGLPQDLVAACPEVSAEISTEDSSSGTRRRLYRDVLKRATCSAFGEDSMPSRPVSPTAITNSADKFDLLEEEALMQYQSSDDSLAERKQQSQNQRQVDGGSSTSTPTTGTTRSATKQRRFKDPGCKPTPTTPPPPPPAPPRDEVQSPRRRLYRDVLAHRHTGNTEETTGAGAPSESTSWTDVLQRLEEQALMEYRLSDDSALTTEEASQRPLEEALTRRYKDLERQALVQYLRGTPSNSEVQGNREGETSNERNQRGLIGGSRGGSQLQEDVMVNLKLLQRANPRPTQPKSQTTRSFSLQDNQADKRVYRKRVLKKPVQLKPELQVQHHHENSNSNQFVQMTPHLPQQMHMFNNPDLKQRTHQQLLQEQLALLHFNQVIQPTFEQLNPFHQVPQKLPKLPQPDFCFQQQNYQLCQQPPPQSTLPQPFSQLHLIELQQRLSHPGLSPQQVAELQTLYQHQTLATPDPDFLQQQKSTKQYPQKTIIPKVPLQKQTHRRENSQPKIQPLESQEIQHLELQQRMASNVPLLLSLPPIVAPQAQLMEMQSRWMNSHSCPPSLLAPQSGLLDPHGDMALGGVQLPSQPQASPRLQDRQPIEISTIQVTDSPPLTSSPKLSAGESSGKRNVALSTSLNTDTGTKDIGATSKSSLETLKEPNKKRNESKSTKKSETKKKKPKNNGDQKKSKNRAKVKNTDGKEASSDIKSCEELSQSCESPLTNDVSPFLGADDKNLILKTDRKKTRLDEVNNEAKRRRTDNESKVEMFVKNTP